MALVEPTIFTHPFSSQSSSPGFVCYLHRIIKLPFSFFQGFFKYIVIQSVNEENMSIFFLNCLFPKTYIYFMLKNVKKYQCMCHSVPFFQNLIFVLDKNFAIYIQQFWVWWKIAGFEGKIKSIFAACDSLDIVLITNYLNGHNL